MDQIIKFQKKAARLILDKDIDLPSECLFKELKWMRFDERIHYKKSILMYQVIHKTAPTYLQQNIHYVSDIHSHNLRSQTDELLYVPKPNSELYRKTFHYSGSKIWNSLPTNLKKCQI